MGLRDMTRQLEEALREYAIEHIEWPDTPEEIHRAIKEEVQEDDNHGGDLEESIRRVLREEDEYLAQQEPTLFGSVTSTQTDSDENARKHLLISLCDIVRRAYLEAYDGYSIDRLIADPDKNARFVQQCWANGAKASQSELNQFLLNARKDGLIGAVPKVERFHVAQDVMDHYLFACEWALRTVQDQEYFNAQRSVSLDRILCDPQLGQRFEAIARAVAPGYESFDYRWAAIAIRKGRRRLPIEGSVPSFEVIGKADDIRPKAIMAEPGLFWVQCDEVPIYIGHAESLRDQLVRFLEITYEKGSVVCDVLHTRNLKHATYAIAPSPRIAPTYREAMKGSLVKRQHPRLNIRQSDRDNGLEMVA